MAVRKIAEAGNPKLKAKNAVVANLKSPKLKKLIKDLEDTMYKTDLIGISAPQIAENYMVFITHLRETAARKLQKVDELRVFINPKITYKSKKQNEIYEGCGSLGGNVDNAGIFGPVIRPEEVEVVAFDASGRKFRLRANGILARVIQHEYDHLKGIEFIEKVPDLKRLVMERHYRKYIRLSKKQIENSKVTRIEII